MPFPISTKKFFIPRFVVSSEGLQRKSKKEKEKKKTIPYWSPEITMQRKGEKITTPHSFYYLCVSQQSTSLVSYIRCWLPVIKEETKTFPIHTWCIFITAANRVLPNNPSHPEESFKWSDQSISCPFPFPVNMNIRISRKALEKAWEITPNEI